MKVLSGHVVTKSQAEESKDLFIMAVSAVHENSGPSPFQQTTESNLINSSDTENISRRRWKRLFRRVQKKTMDSDSPPSSPKTTSFFGRALFDVCEVDGTPPKPIMDILLVLWRKGPHTIGLFRKAGNAKRQKEIREQLNNGAEVDLKDEHVILLCDLLKDFLRQLPGKLLMAEHYKAWMAAMERQDAHDKCTELQTVINKLPKPNSQLLKHLMAVLYHIHLKNEINKMDSRNLAVCVSPNLLQADGVEAIQNVTNLTQFLIENCCEIFGEDVLTLLGDSDEEELNDNHDSMSSLHHDSAYDSNDPDADGSKESFTDMQVVHSDAEDKAVNQFEASSCSGAVGRNTAKPFTRRCSEPTIGFNKGARNQTSLTRSQTEMDFYEHHLTKQISDECVLFRKGSRVSRNTHESKDSCSSLESSFSSASESSIHTSSPIISSSTQRRALLRKQSFPTRLSARGSETTKKRSQSMKASGSRTKASFSQSASRRVEKALRHSQTLPEVLLFDRTFPLVDSRIPSKPPSYQEAIQDNTHVLLSHRSSLTVEAARCLSKNTSCQSTFPTAETSDFCSVKDCSDGGEKTPTLPASASSAKSETCSTTLSPCQGQQMLDTANVRESYV